MLGETWREDLNRGSLSKDGEEMTRAAGRGITLGMEIRDFWMSNEKGNQRTEHEAVTNLPGKIFIAAGSSKKA